MSANDDAKYAEQMLALASMYTEDGHRAADKLLCEILLQHGYAETVRAFEELDKWYE